MRLYQRIVSGVLAATLLGQMSGCGTLFYPERRGQIKGQIDPAIAVLDGIGILFFVIPGLIAFAVDFTTGAPGPRWTPGSPGDRRELAAAGHRWTPGAPTGRRTLTAPANRWKADSP